ncbi:hypothetical protein ABBQ38_009287 [Trebouxia sp. C0009 RCD-2024]
MASGQPVASGTDGQYRMVVEDRYKQVAAGRRQLHNMAFTQGIFNLMRTLWHTFPAMLHGSDQMPPLGNIGVMVSALFAFLVYTAGSGFGDPRNQSRGLLFLYGIISAIHAALIGLSFVQYHLKRDEPLYHLTHAAPFISQLTTGQAKDPNVHALLWMAEAAIDMFGMAIAFEATKHAVSYIFVSGSASQKKKSS